MAEVQARAVAALEKGEGAEGELGQLRAMVGKREMPHYAARVRELADGGIDRLAKLPMVVHDLLPKFEKVYLATGEGMVRKEAGYREFNELERRELAAANAKPKPSQPTRSISHALRLAVRARPVFEGLMEEVARATAAGGKGFSPEGVQWEPAPLKKVGRCVEKLCLDPAQRGVLERATHDAEELNAEGILDMVRGMFTCNSMAHAHAVLRELVARFGAPDGAGARLVRSKNRFEEPSGGGWMDCLVNVEVDLPDGGGGPPGRYVCEVQIVHRQLLVVRTELGAHHGCAARAARARRAPRTCRRMPTGARRAQVQHVPRGARAARVPRP